MSNNKKKAGPSDPAFWLEISSKLSDALLQEEHLGNHPIHFPQNTYTYFVKKYSESPNRRHREIISDLPVMKKGTD
jgi:hypothetical protein